MSNTIGLISDTHGLLRPEALEALMGSDIIIHAGDIGKPGIIEQLNELAPTYAIRGNVDKAPWASVYPATEVVEYQNRFFYVLHDVNDLDLDPEAAGFEVVIFGHSHKPLIYRKQDVLYINPGSAGRRRFSLPISIARLELGPDKIEATIVELDL